MGKDKTKKELSPFRQFQNFAKALIAVPKKELDQKLEKYKRTRGKKS